MKKLLLIILSIFLSGCLNEKINLENQIKGHKFQLNARNKSVIVPLDLEFSETNLVKISDEQNTKGVEFNYTISEDKISVFDNANELFFQITNIKIENEKIKGVLEVFEVEETYDVILIRK